MAGLGAGVADGSSGIDAAGGLDGPGSGQDGFEECRFTALERAHQCDAPWTSGTSDVLSHCRLLISGARPVIGSATTNAPPLPRFWQAGKIRCTASSRFVDIPWGRRIF